MSRLTKGSPYLLVLLVVLAAAVTPARAPTIESLFKPERLKGVLSDREIVTSAKLHDPDAAGDQLYEVSAAMRVRESIARTSAILTDYKVYKKIIRYVQRAEYDPKTQILQLEGGIFSYRLVSKVHFEQRTPGWVHYRFVGGHFQGMEGDFFFESKGERGTLVAVRGQIIGRGFPPRFVIEKGAEIVFGYTASRMRSYVENDQNAESKKAEDEVQNAGEAKSQDERKESAPLPTPRRGLIY